MALQGPEMRRHSVLILSSPSVLFSVSSPQHHYINLLFVAGVGGSEAVWGKVTRGYPSDSGWPVMGSRTPAAPQGPHRLHSIPGRATSGVHRLSTPSPTPSYEAVLHRGPCPRPAFLRIQIGAPPGMVS